MRTLIAVLRNLRLELIFCSQIKLLQTIHTTITSQSKQARYQQHEHPPCFYHPTSRQEPRYKCLCPAIYQHPSASFIVTNTNIAPRLHPRWTDTRTIRTHQGGRQEKLGHNLGRLGPRGFQSRSMQAWQEAYDEGTVWHTFAPIQYKQKLLSGELRREEVPYMVRKKWKVVNSNVKGAKKLPWSKKDKEYAAGGFKKEQSVSILGSGPGFDWTGKQDRETLRKKRFPGFS